MNQRHAPPAASLGTGFLRLMAPEPGMRRAIHHYPLTREAVLKRLPSNTQPETLLFPFHAFDTAPTAGAHLPTAQVALTNFGL